MSFWSSQTLKERLLDIAPTSSEHAIDCNALTLCLGREIYVTPNQENATTATVVQLGDHQTYVVPPGHFAFLLTEEKVAVPPTAMAFISMKATYKMMGLVNVSGFHVDPGFNGPLVFSVYNAGPTPIQLRQGMELFLMWFADLDHASEKRKSAPSDNQIPMKFLTGLNGATKSAAAVEERLLKRIEILEKNHGHMRLTIAGVVAVALLVGAAMYPLFLAPFYKQVEGSLDTRGSHQPATGAAATQPSQGTSTNKKGPAQ